MFAAAAFGEAVERPATDAAPQRPRRVFQFSGAEGVGDGVAPAGPMALRKWFHVYDVVPAGSDKFCQH